MTDHLGPHDVLHQNVFEQNADKEVPVKNESGEVVGRGWVTRDGHLEVELFKSNLDLAPRVQAFSFSKPDNTITTIMRNKQRN